MKKIIVFLIIFVFLSFRSQDKDVLMQVSTLQALQEGYYDGVVRLNDMKVSGDIGIGTFNALDGELIKLDGVFYQVKADGNIYIVSKDESSPFIMTTSFESDKKIYVENIGSLKEFQDYLVNLLPSKNIIYAFKITVSLKYVKTRSVPKQDKPYPRLVEVVKNQPTFENSNVKGVIVGFWIPDYLKGVNMSGFHFHFITDDKKFGGHLLECNIEKAIINMDYTYGFNMILPEKSGFFNIDLSGDKSNELQKIEK
jgi:acetolactate decarboxylase